MKVIGVFGVTLFKPQDTAPHHTQRNKFLLKVGFI